jgi:hypothetical protein
MQGSTAIKKSKKKKEKKKRIKYLTREEIV